MELLAVGRSVNPGDGQHTERRKPYSGSMEKKGGKRERAGSSLDGHSRVWHFAEGLGGSMLPAEAVNGFFRVVNLFGEDNIGILWTLAAWGDSGKEASLERISGKKKSPPFDMVSTMLLLYDTLKL